MIKHYTSLFQVLAADTLFQSWLKQLPKQVTQALDPAQHGDLNKWQVILQQLPEITASKVDFTAPSIKIGQPGDCTQAQQSIIERLLQQLHPWRKGPYTIHGIDIDTEWRSDMKWNRLQGHISPLNNRLILDVGCGNGYHCWRMLGEGAKRVIGIDPGLLFVLQFLAIKNFSDDAPIHVLPLGIQDVPAKLQAFDSVFSMGVLYHRKSPIDHLQQLFDCLRSGGELILETLVIEGNADQVLMPETRYAKMRNVWFLPACAALALWLKRCGYQHIRLIHICKTTAEEQRSSDWMRFHSLSNFLDPDNPDLTCEGLPAPKRAIFVAEKP